MVDNTTEKYILSLVMTEGEAPEIKAPDGTFQLLSNVLGKKYNRLGNAYTKRVVKVSQMEKDPQTLIVAVRLLESMGGEVSTSITFRINPAEQITDLQATRKIGYPESTEPLKPPSFLDVLKEIRAAQHIQPKLKR